MFRQSSCTGIFISRIGPQPWPFYQNDFRRNSYTVEFQVPVATQERSPSIEQLRIASVFTSGVNQQQHIERTNPRNAWKTPLSSLWPISVNRSWPSSFSGSGDDRIRADRPVSNNYNVPMSTSKRGTGRGGVFAR